MTELIRPGVDLLGVGISLALFVASVVAAWWIRRYDPEEDELPEPMPDQVNWDGAMSANDLHWWRNDAG